MSGMNKHTGRLIESDRDHLMQSIEDILTTPKGSRVMNREYGSDLFLLVDAPVANKVDIYAAVAEALDRFEPRFDLKEVSLDGNSEGVVEIVIRGEYLPSQEMITKRIGV